MITNAIKNLSFFQVGLKADHLEQDVIMVLLQLQNTLVAMLIIIGLNGTQK